MEGLSVVCAGLGVVEEDEDGNRIGYAKDEYCLDNLKDLLRFLRRDDPQTREVFKQVCKWNTVGKDLIPIIEHCQDDRNLVLNAVKVLVFLSMPIDPTSSDIPQQLEYLWGLKYSIAGSHTVPVIISLLEVPLENLESEAFTDDDWKLVQLVLTLFRNFLAIQDISAWQKAGGSATQYITLRDKFLEMLFQENVMDLILVLSQHTGVSGCLRHDNLLLLETYHYIFLGHEAELIVKAYSKNSKDDRAAEESLKSLRSIMEEEEEQKRKLNRLRNLTRHSQFSGTFTRLTLDGAKTLFKGNPCLASHDPLLQSHNNHRGPTKRMAWDHGKLPLTKNNVLRLLYDFLTHFLAGGYNVLIQSVCEDIEKEHHAVQNNDIIVLFRVAQFVTSFQHHKFLTLKLNNEAGLSEDSVNHQMDSEFEGSICGPLAASMNESMFQLLISKWRYAFDGLKETNDYNFLSAAGSLMKMMIRMLDLVLKLSPDDSKESRTARILLYKLFYDQTEDGMTQFLLNLIKAFNTHKQAKSDLADLVETIHVILRLLEKLQESGILRVSRKARRKRKKRTLHEKDKNEIVESAIQSGIDPPSTDAIQHAICSDGAKQSPYLSMSEREAFLNQSSDGKEDNMRIPNEADLSERTRLNTQDIGHSISDSENKKTDDTNDDLCYDSDDSSGDEQAGATDEVDFKVSTLVSALVNSSIIQNLCWLLKFYKSNSTSTNHYIICILKRLCDDMELSPMLYQLSFLTIFYDILVDQKSNPCAEYANIVVFLTNLVRRMMRKMKNYPLLFVEILFWKTRKECHYINCESMIIDLGKLRKESRKWEAISADGETGLCKEGWICRSIADALGEDEADFVMSRVDDDKGEDHCGDSIEKVSRRNNEIYDEARERIASISDEVIGEENSDKKGHLADHDHESLNRKRKVLVFNAELEEKLKDLYEQYKDDRNCGHLIAESLALDTKVSAAQVYKKLNQLGFKVPMKKRHVPAANQEQPGEESVSEKNIVHPSSNDMEEDPSVKKPLHTRKRIRAFSKDQELMIKALFEKFKDHKRCSYMIANALDSDGTFSAAQITRKLKQLGLCAPKQKKADTNLHLRDEDLADHSLEEAGCSDNETLLSLRKRRKTKINEIEREERLQETTRQSLQDDSEVELLSSIFGKTRRVLPKMADGENSAHSMYKVDEDIMTREEQSSEMECRDISDETLNHAGVVETNSMGKGDGKRVSAFDNANHLQQQQAHEDLFDELVDFEDDISPFESQRAVASRRKSRMVIDFEDEE